MSFFFRNIFFRSIKSCYINTMKTLEISINVLSYQNYMFIRNNWNEKFNIKLEFDRKKGSRTRMTHVEFCGENK